ncbi:MAG: hypothetical protein ACREAC_09565, partial [Blastocatellia bacterium]
KSAGESSENGRTCLVLVIDGLLLTDFYPIVRRSKARRQKRLYPRAQYQTTLLQSSRAVNYRAHLATQMTALPN